MYDVIFTFFGFLILGLVTLFLLINAASAIVGVGHILYLIVLKILGRD